MRRNWVGISFITVSILAVIIILTLLVDGQDDSGEAPVPIEGVLTLTRPDLQTSQIFKLDGEWEFADGVVQRSMANPAVQQYYDVKVPSAWINYGQSSSNNTNKKTGTFLIQIKLPPQAKQETWAFYIPDIRTARQVWINGAEVDSQGIVSDDLNRAVSYDLPHVSYFSANSSTIELKIAVSNNFYERTGGINNSIYFGTAESIAAFQQSKNMTDIGTTLIYLVFGFLFFVLFIHRRKDKVLLAFALYNLLSALLYLTNNELLLLQWLPDMSFRIFHLIQFLVATMNVTLLLLYTKLAIPNQTRYFVFKILIFVSILSIFIPILLPLPLQTIIGYWHPLFFLISLLAVVYSMMKAVLMREEFSVYLYLSALSLLIVFTINMLDMYGMIELDRSPLFFMVFFGLANAAFLAARHSKAHEKAEKLAQDLQLQDKVKNDFLAKTSHELRTPLHGIMNMIGLYIEREKQFMKDEDLENMRLVLDISNRLSRLVNDILDMEQMNEHKLRMNYSCFSVEKCLTDVVNVCRHVYAERSNQIVLTIDQEMRPVVLDSDRFKQILYNLLDNSMNHTQSGTITIQASMIDESWVIVVRDDGEGIPADKLDKIFDPYEHFNNTKNFGIGIGLSIVKQLVDYMGGSIRVESEYGHGTSFRLEFGNVSQTPIEEESHGVVAEIEWMLPSNHHPKPKSSEFATPHMISQNGEHLILLVDDNFSNLKVMLDALRNDGHNIIAVKNGTEMLEVVRAHPEIDLVVMDLLLPDYSGYELCGKMRETMSMVELPILILTAAINPEDLQYALSLGANDFIHKPYPVNELRARVNSLLHMKSAAKRSATYEIAFLHAQIKPHFLYNALNTIAEFCLKDPSEASSLIISLSKYLRGTLDFSNLGNLVSVDRELALVKAYLKIEKARFPELKTELEMDQNIDVQLPPMTLQVLVENAVKHGVICRENGGLVKITIRNEEDGTSFSVENDGAGIPEDQIEEILKAPKAEGSIGLYNVNTRLMKMYGTGLTFSRSEEPGFKVSFLIPNWRNR